LPLVPDKCALRCASGHSFDRAREGYCNLLLVHQKATLHPGDNPEMVAARRKFLEAGYYRPLAERLLAMVRVASPSCLLDAGCGEGYYLGQLRSALPGLPLAGTDISRAAIKAAAKKHKGIPFAVASNKQLPFAPQSMGAILSLFGFPAWEGFKKVLSADGRVVLVDPGPDHLLELREQIYAEVKRTEVVSLDEAFSSGFILEAEEKMDFRFHLPSQEAIQDLLAMTPHGYRMGQAGKERVGKLDGLEVRASVVIRTLGLR